MEEAVQENEKAANLSEYASVEDGSQQATMKEEGYVCVTGLVGNEKESRFVKSFFTGLDVVNLFFCIEEKTLHRTGQVIVKFGSAEQAAAALKYRSKDGKKICIEATDKSYWIEATRQAASFRKSRKEYVKNIKLQEWPVKRKKLLAVSRVSPVWPCCVHLLNLPYSMTKEEFKSFIGKEQIEDLQITFFVDKDDFSTKEAFVMLSSKKQMRECLRFHQKALDDRTVYVFPSSKETLQERLTACRSESSGKAKKISSEKTLKLRSKLKCMYVRNFPAYVTKLDVQHFFAGFNVNLEDIFLLYDDNGAAMGEALVKFSTEHVAMFAESLHRRNFLGTEILLLRISEEQMKGFYGARR